MLRPLTYEIKDAQSPVHRFLTDRFGNHRDVQRRFLSEAGPLVIPGNDANPGTMGTAADWLLRFLLYPHPDVHLAELGAHNLRRMRPTIHKALAEIENRLGTAIEPTTTFTGPSSGSGVDSELLARGCWALALLTEAFRAGPMVAAAGPLGQLPQGASADDLLALASPGALDQLAQFRKVFESALIPELADRRGDWSIGPTFAGSALMNGADADLIAAGLLLDLKTVLGRKRSDGSRRPGLEKTDLFQLVGYTLLDFADEHKIGEVGVFSARFGYLATWRLDDLLAEMAGREVDVAASRQEFERLLREYA